VLLADGDGPYLHQLSGDGVDDYGRASVVSSHHQPLQSSLLHLTAARQKLDDCRNTSFSRVVSTPTSIGPQQEQRDVFNSRGVTHNFN